MQFVWHKSNKSQVTVDTNDCVSTAAANYLAKNWGQICGLDLVRLSEASKWLGAFSSETTAAQTRRAAAAARINDLIAQLVTVRYIDSYQLQIDTDSEGTVKRKEILNAAEEYACAYQIGILTGAPPLHPCRVRNSAPLPVLVLPAPATVIDALIGVPALHGANDEQLSAALKAEVERVMDRLHPVGRDWISDRDLDAWHGRLFAVWKPYLALLPLDPRGTTISPPPSPQPQPDVEMTDAQPRPGEPEIVPIDVAPEVPAPAVPPVDPAEQAAQQEYLAVMTTLRANVPAKLAGLNYDIARRLAVLRAGGQVHPRQNATSENRALAKEVFQLLEKRRRVGHDGEKWAELLAADGFDLGALPGTVRRLIEQSQQPGTAGQVARTRFNGYAFQIRMMLQAWEESRLRAVEHLVRLEVDRYVDSREWTADGVCCYREYKSYDPSGTPSEEFKRDFVKQLFDYGRAFGMNGLCQPTEYVFEYGVPAWARTALESRKGMFAHGLYVIDAEGGTRERL